MIMSKAWRPLLLLLQCQQLIQHSHGFVVTSNIKHSMKKTTALFMDPYEQQYQQYFQNQNNQNKQVLETTQSYTDNGYESSYGTQEEQQQQQQQHQEQTAYEQQQQQQQSYNGNGYDYSQQQTTTTASAANTAVDPYEQQLQQYYQSLGREAGIQTPTDPVGAAPANDPYAAQYQQQQQQQQPPLQQPQPTAPQTSYQTPPAPPTTEIPPAQADIMQVEQYMQNDSEQQQPPPNQEDEFLRMVSTEVQYKKLLNQNPYSLTDIDYPLILQRFLDNIEDSFQKNNGKIKGQSKWRGQTSPKEERKTVLVLGTGWGSHAFIKLASTYDLRIVVVSPVNHFVFTPMLASAAVGTVEYRSMTEPIRVTNPYIDNFVEGRAIGIDVPNKVLSVQLTSLSTVTGAFKGIAANAPDRLEPEPILSYVTYGDEDGGGEGDGIVKRDESQGAGGVIDLNYDYLVCAVGTASRSSMVPGAKDHCFNLKTSQDSKRLRTAIGEALEFASRPDVQEYYYPDDFEQKALAQQERRRRVRIAIVGGGPTGVELAGELSDFFEQICRYPDGAYQHLKNDVSIMLIHGGSELLPAMDQELRERAYTALQAQGVELRLNTRLKEVGRDYVTIGEKGSDVQETIPVGLTVWAAGNAPVPFVKELLSQLPESAAGSAGRINVDQWLRCPTPTPESFGSILVLGDVACLEAEAKYDPEVKPLPQTAQVAGQQGAFAARMLNRGYDLQQTPPALPDLSEEDEGFSLLRIWLLARGLQEAPGFKFLSLGLLAYVGQEEALNQVQLGDVPIFNYSGKIAFALWRSVYLSKQASSRNQALIAFDWLRTETFGRDITRL